MALRPLLVLALAMFSASVWAGKLRVAILPVAWQPPVFNLISGRTSAGPVYGNSESQLRVQGELLDQAREVFDVESGSRVRDAMAAEQISADHSAYSNCRVMERLKKRLGVDLVIAPLVEYYDYFSGRVTYVYEDPDADDDCEDRSPRLVPVYESGHNSRVLVYVVGAGLRTSFKASNEVIEECVTYRTEERDRRDVVKRAVRLLMGIATRTLKSRSPTSAK